MGTQAEKHKNQVANEKINKMVSEELADKNFYAEGYDDAAKELLQKYGDQDNEYLVDGAILHCDRATAGLVLIKGLPIILTPGMEVEERKMTILSVSENASLEKDQRMATVKDHVKKEDPENDTGNIKPFMCNCLNQPKNDDDAYDILRNQEYYRENGTCCKLMKLDDDWENIIRDTQYHTYSYGTGNRVEEAEGVTMLSMLFCSNGGLITPVTSGQIIDLNEYKGLEQYAVNANLVKKISFIYPEWNDTMRKFVEVYEKNIERYMCISQQAGVPPEIIAVIHYRENTPDYFNGDFASDIHNGAWLNGKDFDKEALDTMGIRKNDIAELGITSDTTDIVALLCLLERHNGLGYYKYQHMNPYLYSGTNVYISGKYDATGHHDDSIIDEQAGAYILLYALANK